MITRRSRSPRHRFPPDIISHAVWLYHRYPLTNSPPHLTWTRSLDSQGTRPFHRETSRRNRPGTIRFLRSFSPARPRRVLAPLDVDRSASPAPRYTLAMNPVDGVACARPGCDNRGKPGLNIVGYGSFATKSGRRQRYRCTVCRGTVSANTGTAYSGLRCTRREFEQVASLRVEGVSLSATARVTGHSRNTVARWLERASTAAKRFNDRMLRGFDHASLDPDDPIVPPGLEHLPIDAR